MKKSDAARKLAQYLKGLCPEEYKDLDIHERTLDATLLIEFFENELGMLPPKMVGTYDTVPTVTPTGNHDYCWKRGWETE